MPTTELAEARRAFGFFETIHACITAEAQPRKRHRKETSAIPEPMQDPRQNWRKLDERLDFSRLFTPASPQRHSREKDTARRLLPFRSPCKTHDGKISGDSAKVFVASVFDARRIADELSVPFLWQCCDTGIQPDWVEETLEDSAVTFRFPKSQNTGLDTASHFGRGIFVPRLSKCRPERYIR